MDSNMIIHNFDAIFETLDLKNEGRCTKREFVAFLQAVGISIDHADASFDLIADGNNYMTRKQFSRAYFRYWFDAKPSKYMHFYGIVENWKHLAGRGSDSEDGRR